MFNWFFGQSGSIDSLCYIQPDWIFDGQIDNRRINAMFKTTDDRFRLILDYIPDDNTGYKSCWIYNTSVDFKVEFLGEEVFTGNGNPFLCSKITGDGFCLHPSNSYAVIANPTENGLEITYIRPGKLKWTESKDQHGTITTRRCTAGGQHYYENIKRGDRFILEAQIYADIQLEHNYINAQTLDNGSIKYRNSLRDGTLVTGELSNVLSSIISNKLDFELIFQQGTTIFRNGLLSFLKRSDDHYQSTYQRKTNNLFGELDNFEVSGNTTVGKSFLQEHILRSSIFGGYTQFGDHSVMTISENRIGHKYEGIWSSIFKPLPMKKQLDLNNVMQGYYERVMLIESNKKNRKGKFICYTKHTESGILEFIMKQKHSYLAKITISSNNKLRFVK